VLKIIAKVLAFNDEQLIAVGLKVPPIDLLGTLLTTVIGRPAPKPEVEVRGRFSTASLVGNGVFSCGVVCSCVCASSGGESSGAVDQLPDQRVGPGRKQQRRSGGQSAQWLQRIRRLTAACSAGKPYR
jgi:hypothetical protein